MRVILKPAGLAVVLTTIALLAGIAIFLSRWALVNTSAANPNPANLKALEKAKARRKATAGRGFLSPQPVTLVEKGEQYATVTPLEKTDFPEEALEGYRIKVTDKPEKFHAVQIRFPIQKAVPEGRSVTLHFWARSPTRDRLSAFVGERDADYSRSFFVTLNPPATWKQYVYTFAVPAMKPEKAELRLAFGHDVGEVDIAGVGLN